MLLGFCSQVWRRKLSFLLIGSGLLLFALWTWIFLEVDSDSYDKVEQLTAHDSSTQSNKHAFLIQKLISKANRVLRNQLQSSTHNTHSSAALYDFDKKSSPTKFLRPIELEEASAQTIALIARHKKTGGLLGESLLFEEERLKVLENQQKARNSALEEFNMNYENVLTSSERQTQYEHELQRMGVPTIAGIGPTGPRAPHERLVHLDLKGAPPKLSFLKQMLPMLKTLGATGLLIEYEDMFPYKGALATLAARNAYKEQELQDFLQAVAQHDLTVMPLVQTFGHMEFALKSAGFQHLREIPESPQSICPSQKESLSFIESMLSQVIEFHLHLSVAGLQNSSGDAGGSRAMPLKFTHMHIGCDEVYRMGECGKCRGRMRNEIFLNHVTTIANLIRLRWPHLQVVIWDDMLRNMALSELKHSNVGSYVEPMVWVYANDIYHFITPQLWDTYAQVFATAWAASSFKGAFGESLMIPPLQQHLENNIRWLAVIAKEGGRFAKGIKGLALTGWQRYDHFAVLCELLPTSMPSLITTLSTVARGYFSTNPKENDLLKVLECVFHPDSRRSGHPWIEFHVNSHRSQLFSTCNYLGSKFYKYTLRLFEALQQTEHYLTAAQSKSAWLSDYNVRHNFSSPLRVRDLTARTQSIIEELSRMSREAYELLYEIYDEHTIAEFIEQHIYPSIAALHSQQQKADNLVQRRDWPQRPLPYARELQDLNLIPQSPAHN